MEKLIKNYCLSFCILWLLPLIFLSCLWEGIGSAQTVQGVDEEKKIITVGAYCPETGPVWRSSRPSLRLPRGS